MAATYAHLFTDIAGYSRMFEERGVDEMSKVMRTYERIVRSALPRKRAEADHIGDGFHLVFPTASEAIVVAREIADELQRQNTRRLAVPLRVRFAVEAGQASRRRGVLVGDAVMVAAHMIGHADPGQVLVGEGAWGLLPSKERTSLRDLGVWQLGRIAGLHIHEARPPDPTADGKRHPKRVLATALHTDIVASTSTGVARKGQDGWKDMFEKHHAIVRQELHRHGGVEVDTAGDGFYATFDMPSNALDCAFAMRARIRSEVGIEIRAGIHTGECEVIAGKIGGMAVVIGGRIKDGAGGGEVLTSRTVKDLLLGMPYAFTPRGSASLKGVPGEWDIYAVEPSAVV